jgi:hypothetical protein
LFHSMNQIVARIRDIHLVLQHNFVVVNKHSPISVLVYSRCSSSVSLFNMVSNVSPTEEHHCKVMCYLHVSCEE